MVVDPLSEAYSEHSPFVYVLNNPLRFIDPNARDVTDLGDRTVYTGDEAIALYNSLKSDVAKESRNPSVILATEAVKESVGIMGAWGGRLLGTIGLFLISHDAGVSNEWVMQLTRNEEDRYQQLLGKRSKLLAGGNDLTPPEFEKLFDLENKKYPHGHGNLSYDPATYHTDKDTNVKNRAPTNPQELLAQSLLVKAKKNGSQRIAVQGKDEFVIFDEHRPGVFHGHIRSWQELSRDQKNTLINNKITNENGKRRK